jgi:sugar-phosphatase
VTITADDVELGKPNPEPFLAAADRLGVAPERCVVCEDSASGGLAARAAGATVCAVGDQPWPFDPVARIADLRSIEVSVVRAGSGVVLTIDSSRGRTGNPLTVG